MWHRFVSNNYRYDPQDPEYRRVYLLNAILLILAVSFLSFAILDVTIANYVAIAFVNLTGFSACVLTLRYFHTSQNREAASWLTILILTLALASFMALTGPSYYAFVWTLLLPPISLFLLGRARGMPLAMILMAAFVGYLSWRYPYWPSVPIGFEGVLNIAGALLCLTALVIYFESSKEATDTALRERNAELAHLSSTDSLTGLANRKHINETLRYEIAQTRRANESLAVLLCDIDNFKLINDEHGHLVGDKVLATLASVLRQGCREADTIGRWGGEEFLIVCPNTQVSGARALADKLCATLAGGIPDSLPAVTLSLGVCVYREEDNVESMIRRADEALYRAKRAGRDRVEVSE